MKSFKFSWKTKMMLIVLFSVFGVILITWVLNKTFLESYYIYSKINSLDKVYNYVQSLLVDGDQKYIDYLASQEETENDEQTVEEDEGTGDVSEETDEVTEDETNEESGSLDNSGDTEEKSEVNPKDSQGMKRGLEYGYQTSSFKDLSWLLNDEDQLELQTLANSKDMRVCFQWWYDPALPPISYNNGNISIVGDNEISMRLHSYLFPGPSQEYNIQNTLKTTENYIIYQVKNSRTGNTYIELFAINDDVTKVMLIRTSLESLQESVDTSN
ncbi:MAG: hypothetical protein K6B75_01525, partial [Lachnospiraceae bacterium]|nr:hypothetical protein [Lachnospiraceae bacterium]